MEYGNNSGKVTASSRCGGVVVRSKVDQDEKDMQADEGGPDCVYVCGMCEARPCRARGRKALQQVCSSVDGWMGGGEGGGRGEGGLASEKA